MDLQTFYGKGPHSLLWARLRDACGTIKVSGITHCINYTSYKCGHWRPMLYGLQCLLLGPQHRRTQLDAVLHSYNLTGIVDFHTRFGLNSQTAIDTVFLDTSTIGKYDLHPLINGLSDHDAQLLILNKGQRKEKECYTYIKEKSIGIP